MSNTTLLGIIVNGQRELRAEGGALWVNELIIEIKDLLNEHNIIH